MTSVLPSIALVLGLVVIFVAERVLGGGGASQLLLGLGALLVLGATGWRGWERTRVKGDARRVETWLLAAHAAVLVALGLYALATDWGLALLGVDDAEESRVGPVLWVLWPAVLGTAVLTLGAMEAAYRRMRVAEAVELRRVRSAAFDGLTIALALVFVVSLGFVAHQRNERTDLSYFATTRPGEGTLGMVESLGTDVKAVLFFPRNNEVLEQVEPYFEAIAESSEHVTYEVVDHALAPTLTSKHRISGNGVIALLRGEGESQQSESFEVGTDLEAARDRLKTLDGRFQEALAKLVLQRRELALTAGHREHTRQGAEGDDAGGRITGLMSALERSNITTTPLGMAQGLANDVPEGTPAVAVLGPREPFLPEEAQALVRYVQRGGRLVVAVDPNEEHGLEPLLHALGVQLEEGVLASERQHLRRTFTEADRGIVFTNRYTAHPTVTLASRNASRLATVFLNGGALTRHEGEAVLEGAEVTFPVRSGAETWLDRDGDWERDEGEPAAQHEMIAAVTVPPAEEGGEEGRAVVIGDGDFVTDQLIRNPGNALVFGDVMQWLIGTEQLPTSVESEEDRPIEHTAEEDELWFYGTSFGVPLPLLGVGIWMATRRRRSRREEPTHREPEKDEDEKGEGEKKEAAS